MWAGCGKPQVRQHRKDEEYMLERWINQLSQTLQADSPDASASQADLQRVSAQLLVEVARADHSIDDAERQSMRMALCQAFELDESEIDAILDAAIAGADGTVSLHAHVALINDHLDKPAKLALVEQMWRVAMADGDLDKYEEYTIRKLCDLLYVKHRDFMQTKLRVVS